MLAEVLNTNEIKNSAGTEVEFTRLDSNGRSVVYAQIAETPYLKNRMTIQHREVGDGIKRVRQSNLRFDKQSLSLVDNSTVVNTSVSLTLNAPVGALTTSAEIATVLAYMMSFLASLGASTTILYDGTGNGAKSLINGSL